MIVVDASVLIAHLDENDPLHEQAVGALLAMAEQPLGCLCRSSERAGAARGHREPLRRGCQ